MAKNRYLAENNWYKRHDQLIIHIPQLVKNSLSDATEKIMKLFGTTAYNNTPKDTPEKVMVCLMINIGSKTLDNTSIEQYLEKIRPYSSSMIDELKNQINGKFS